MSIRPSPSTEVILTPFEGAAFPEFRQVFDFHEESSPVFHLARDPEEASLGIVLENRSAKAITALSSQWVDIDQSGERHLRTCSSDSYMVDVYQAIAEPGSRHLITPSGMLDEALIELVLGGGGFMAAGSTSRTLNDVTEMTFEINLILFVDGEISGPDPNRYAVELQCRKPAAEFVAKQIRLARKRGGG